MLPTFVFIVSVSMVKDAYEDYIKAKQDRKENETVVKAYDRNKSEFVDSTWAELRPGDLVIVDNRQPIPADLVAVKSSNPKGQIYVETKSLDGETNLKLKSVPKEVYQREGLEDSFFDKPQKIETTIGKILCQAPNGELYKFTAQLYLSHDEFANADSIPLSPDNLLLRGSSIQNTD